MSRAKGDAAERVAGDFLASRGCRIVARNVYTRFGEIDIIAEKEGVLHFVEVKSGTTFEPIYNITPAKLNRVVRSAQSWMQAKGLDLPWQVDALIVKGGACEWIENVTL
ncbi:YraN family protein [Hydrogenimonas sp.]